MAVGDIRSELLNCADRYAQMARDTRRWMGETIANPARSSEALLVAEKLLSDLERLEAASRRFAANDAPTIAAGALTFVRSHDVSVGTRRAMDDHGVHPRTDHRDVWRSLSLSHRLQRLVELSPDPAVAARATERPASDADAVCCWVRFRTDVLLDGGTFRRWLRGGVPYVYFNTRSDAVGRVLDTDDAMLKVPEGADAVFFADDPLVDDSDRFRSVPLVVGPDDRFAGREPLASFSGLGGLDIQVVERGAGVHMIARYLRNGVAVASGPTVADAVDPSCAPVVNDVRTDGTWVWTGEVAAYVERHGMPLPYELIDHIKSVGGAPRTVSDRRRGAAVEFWQARSRPA